MPKARGPVTRCSSVTMAVSISKTPLPPGTKTAMHTNWLSKWMSGEWFERPDDYLVGAYYKRQNPGFFTAGNLLQTGTENIGMNLSFKLSEADLLRGKIEQTSIDATETFDSTSETIGTLQYIHDHSWWGVTLEYQNRQRDGEQVTSEAGDNSYAAAGLRVDATDDLTLNLDYQQTVTGPSNNQARLGARYQIHPKVALEAAGTVGSEGSSALGGAVVKLGDQELYINQRLADHRPGRSTSTVVGARALVDSSTKLYTEYQWEKNNDDVRNVSVIGAERQWELTRGLEAATLRRIRIDQCRCRRHRPLCHHGRRRL